MTTDEFVKAITSDDITQVVNQCFDELMVLYHIVGTRQDIDICTDNSKMPISFVLLMESENDAIKLTESMNGLDFSVYGDLYSISMSCSGASIHTNINRKVSK